MASFLVRNIDEAFWRRVKSQAALEGLSTKELILRLLSEWLKQPTHRQKKVTP